MTTISRATALAHTNIALVKYWGKRDAALNLPARGSLSLTLDGLRTQTTVELDDLLPADELVLGGVRQDGESLERVARFLDLVRGLAHRREHARVTSENSFPTGSGLASSASAFAALALAATRALGVSLGDEELSVLARRGSGSAARSIFGGFAEMRAGERRDGADAHAAPILEAGAWDVRMVIGVYGGGKPKDVSSRSGMDHTAATSPLYAGWLATVDADLAEARAAIAERDLERLGAVAEASALAMHASAIAARPGVVYWRGATLEALHAVRGLRHHGVAAWGTIDAGPHLKVLCAPEAAERVAATLAAVPGITQTITSRPGGPAHLLPCISASAPGKVLWAGEYAVLDGAPAVVCAVARRAVARVATAAAPLSPFLAAARDQIVAAYGRSSPQAHAAAHIVVDSRALQQDGVKLGLGSSAAATVAAIAAALGSDDPEVVHPLAHRAHAAAQAPRGSRGSGADIAASVHGGFVEVKKSPDDDAPLVIRRLAWPAGLTPVLVWTGEAADTPSLVARVRSFAERDPAGHRAARAGLADAAAGLISALDAGDARAAVAALEVAGQALAALGDRSGAPLVPSSLAPLAALARAHGGAAKPTGAGGGDQILAAFADPGAAAAFSAAARARGMTLVAADVDPAGCRLESLDAEPESE